MPTYTRLYCDNAGESHFDDVEIDFATTDYVPLVPPLDLSAFTPSTRFCFLRAHAGWSSDWHPSPGRQIFFVLGGVSEITASDGETRSFPPGSVLLAEDTTGQGHKSRVVGEVDSFSALVRLGDDVK